jgi:hypothetical protein
MMMAQPWWQQQQYAHLAPFVNNAAPVDPMNSGYFGTAQRVGGNPNNNSHLQMGNADGSGFYDFSGIDGADSFWDGQYGPEGNGPRADPQALSAWLKAKGATIKQGQNGDTGYRWIEGPDGQLIGQPQEYSANDDKAMYAMLAASAVAGGAAYGAAGAGGGVAATSAPGAVGAIEGGTLANAAVLPELAARRALALWVAPACPA